MTMQKFVKLCLVAGMFAAMAAVSGCGGDENKNITYTKANAGLEVVPAAEASFKKNCAKFANIDKWELSNNADTAKRDKTLTKTGIYTYVFKGKDSKAKDGVKHEVTYNVTICPHKVVVMETYAKIDQESKGKAAVQEQKTVSSKEDNKFLNTSAKVAGKQVKVCKHDGKIVKFTDQLKK